MPHLVSPHPLKGLIAPEPPSLSWSHSQQRTFDECARARYWGAEMAPMGWRPDALEPLRIARRLKTLTSLEAELGRSLHERAAARATALGAGDAPPPLAVMRQQIAAHLNYVWQARRRIDDWARDPKKVPMLLDAYYGRAISAERLVSVRERLERGVVALHGLGLWGEVAAAAPADLLVVDSLTSYALPDPEGGPSVQVWAAPDLVFRTDTQWNVVDFKAGRVRDAKGYMAAVRQVEGYAVYLRHGARVLGPEDDCQGRVVFLGDGAEHEFPVRASEIDSAEARIRAGARRMAEYRAAADAKALERLEAAAARGQSLQAQERDALVIDARREAYPMTRNPMTCARCQYLELCASDIATAAREEAA